jgi:flagellar basal-body rod modification protein FlgD
MTTAAIAASGVGSALTGDGSSRVPTQTLGQAEFLKLLVTQLTQQNPLQPIQDTEFIAQMAQFSALEQTKQMEQEVARLRASQDVVQANSLIGRFVQLDDGTSGQVAAVDLSGESPEIVVNGAAYALGSVLFVTAPVN